MRIVLCGGGTAGPIMPLLAIKDEIKKQHPKAEFLVLDVKNSPGELMAKQQGVGFIAMPEVKLRRYFSFKNILVPFSLGSAWYSARKVLKVFKPDCVVGAGGFIQVPVIWAAAFQKIPSLIHQQDLQISLANKLCQPVAAKITVTFPESLSDFFSTFGLFYNKKKTKVILTGNPFRQELMNKAKKDGLKAFSLREDMPVLLVLGGGTGSEFLNNLLTGILPELTKFFQVIHSTGTNRGEKLESQENYVRKNFIQNMSEAYAAADFVLCRAGISTITELSNLKKAAIVVPMPHSHQEYNALLLNFCQAALVYNQSDLNGQILIKILRKLLFDIDTQEKLKNNISKLMPKNSTEKISELVLKLAEGTAK